MRLAITAICLALLSSAHALLAAEPPQATEAVAKAQVLEEKAANGESVTSPPSAPTLTKREATAVDPAGQAPLDDAITCLARSIYWEAKGGDGTDMTAVANVVMNRLGQKDFADTVCGVVKQGSERKGCQFSWWCDGRPDQVVEDDRYELAREVARKALNQQLPDRTHGALFFHDRRVRPAWGTKFVRTAETGELVFYKPRN